MPRLPWFTNAPAFWCWLGIVWICCAASAMADELHLDNGMLLEGTVIKVPGLNTATARQNDVSEIPNYPFYMVDDGVRRYFIPARHATAVDADRLSPYVTFPLFQQKSARAIGPAIIGTAQLDPFDQFGRRTVTLSTNRGPVHIVQGITEVRPDWVKVEGLTHDWEHRLDTKMLPDDILQHIVRQATNQQDSDARKQAVLFFIQAERPFLAGLELDRIAQDFPELEAWSDEFRQRIRELQARLGINELKLRRFSAQHQLAYTIAQKVPVDSVSADVLFEAQEIVKDYETALEKRDEALMLLDLLHAELPEESARELQVMRAHLQDELHYETLGRLDPFLRSASDNTLTASQKLALAYSGWLLGGANALTELTTARSLWTGRFLVLESLQSTTDTLRRDEIVEELRGLEGMSVARLAEMVPQLPLPEEAPTSGPGEILPVTFTGDSGTIRSYSLMLPPEYTPHHRYPLLIVLRSVGQSAEGALRWWGGEAQRPGWTQRRGYVVMAPEYLPEGATQYEYLAESQQIIRECLNHLRHRCRINSDKVFLAGHGTGANAVFDVGLSAPDLFAGAISIAGQIERHPVFLSENGQSLAWYVVGGERDRETLENNAAKLNRMMFKGQDVIYVDYKDRGFEPFGEEQERIVEWMETKSRLLLGETVDFEVGSVRISDNRFHWFAAHNLPEKLFPPIPAEGPATGVNARRYKGHIAPGGPIYINHPGKETTVWLSPDLINFEERHRISINGKVVSTGFVTPSFTALLEDLRLRGDRERLFWAKLSF